MPIVHQSKVGTFHPAPDEPVEWTVHDARGYLDGGAPCDECGACDCGPCEAHESECIGLAFAFLCLDGGDTLCEACAEREGVTIVPCDCGGSHGQ